MAAYPTRPLDLPPIGPHGVERVVEWLVWCRIVDDAFAGLLRRDTDATFSPLGAAWTCEGLDGGPVMLGGIDALGVAVFALRSDLLDADGMRELHLQFGPRFHPSPPHDLRVMDAWDGLWQTVEVPLGVNGSIKPRLEEPALSDLVACLRDPAWAVSVGLAETEELAVALAPQIEAARAIAWSTLPAAEGESGAKELGQSALASVKRILMSARESGAAYVMLELVRGSLRVRIGTASGVQNLPGIREEPLSREVIRLVRELSNVPEDESEPGVLAEKQLGIGMGMWLVQAITGGGEPSLRLTPFRDEKGVPVKLTPPPKERIGRTAKHPLDDHTDSLQLSVDDRPRS